MKRTVRSCSAVGRLRPQGVQERHRGLAALVSRSLPDHAASTAPQHLHGRLTPLLLRTTRRSYATFSSSAHDADRIIDGRKLADQIVLSPTKTLCVVCGGGAVTKLSRWMVVAQAGRDQGRGKAEPAEATTTPGDGLHGAQSRHQEVTSLA
jgi:hypothetical protein